MVCGYIEEAELNVRYIRYFPFASVSLYRACVRVCVHTFAFLFHIVAQAKFQAKFLSNQMDSLHLHEQYNAFGCKNPR